MRFLEQPGGLFLAVQNHTSSCGSTGTMAGTMAGRIALLQCLYRELRGCLVVLLRG